MNIYAPMLPTNVRKTSNINMNVLLCMFSSKSQWDSLNGRETVPYSLAIQIYIIFINTKLSYFAHNWCAPFLEKNIEDVDISVERKSIYLQTLLSMSKAFLWPITDDHNLAKAQFLWVRRVMTVKGLFINYVVHYLCSSRVRHISKERYR